MPHPRTSDREYSSRYSPESSSSYASEPYSDRHDRSGRAVQPYYNTSSRGQRDTRAVQPYSNGSGYSTPRRPVARRRSDSYLDSQYQSQQQNRSKKDQAGGWFKDHGAEVLGAAVGGYAGHKKGDDHLKTASGAAVGAIGAKVVEHQYRKWNDKREDKKVGREVRGREGVRDSHGYGGERERYDSEPRYSSYGRGRSASRGRNRDEQPQSWKDMGRQLKRSLSRKRADGREGLDREMRDHDEHPRSWGDVGREIKRGVSRRREERRSDRYSDDEYEDEDAHY